MWWVPTLTHKSNKLGQTYTTRWGRDWENLIVKRINRWMCPELKSLRHQRVTMIRASSRVYPNRHTPLHTPHPQWAPSIMELTVLSNRNSGTDIFPSYFTCSIFNRQIYNRFKCHLTKQDGFYPSWQHGQQHRTMNDRHIGCQVTFKLMVNSKVDFLR